MKKMLSCLAAGLLTASAASSVTACSDKAIASLNDSSFKLETTMGDKYDIMRWSSDVLAADAYKSKFVNLFREHNSGINGSNPWTILELIKGQQDSKILENNPSLISQFIADYQKSSNTGDKDEKYNDPSFYDQQLTYKIFDQNNEDQNSALITTFDSGQWTDNSSELVVKEQNDVFIIHLKIAIETGHSDYFIGARQNIENKDDIKQYYPDLKNNEEMPETDNYDYRYDIQFYFSID